MTTPALTPISSAFAAVRYYTGGDPYHYTVDNRPLTDLATNDSSAGLAADAGRRGALLNSLNRAIRFENQFGTTRYVEGLLASNPGANTIRVGVGSIFESLAISTGDSRTVMKQAILPGFKDFAINTVSITGGQSVIYAIEMKYTDFSSSTATTFPIYDKDNPYLHPSVLFGELQLQVIAGSAAATGAEAAPGTTAGWVQLYHVTVNGASPTTYSKVVYASGFTFNSWGLPAQALALTNLSAGGSTSSTVDDIPTTHFADGSTQTAATAAQLTAGGILVPLYNPYKPVKLKLTYSPTVSTNNFRIRVSYAYLRAASSVASVSYTALTDETIAAGTADQLQVLTLTGVVPGTGGIDQNSYDTLRVKIARIGADGADTNTGVLRVFSTQAFQ